MNANHMKQSIEQHQPPGNAINLRLLGEYEPQAGYQPGRALREVEVPDGPPENAHAPRERGGDSELATNVGKKTTAPHSVVNWTDSSPAATTAAVWRRAARVISTDIEYHRREYIMTGYAAEPLAVIEKNNTVTAIVPRGMKDYAEGWMGCSLAPAFAELWEKLTGQHVSVCFSSGSRPFEDAEEIYRAFLEQLVWRSPRAAWMRATRLTESVGRLQVIVPSDLVQRTRSKAAAEYLEQLEDCWLGATSEIVIASFINEDIYENN